ncbi:cobyrinate a,c-diamide synthase [Desulfobaculum xiamenense]|uniref:cobyrinate a,c-diamide synthase n=1 Tax=Desulfobaculum xiamenense TaxID=995050 RepID=UPI001FD7C09F|nr:cobyrinate a,c-diamide synthase [Desulfobaculum xiamenense]
MRLPRLVVTGLSGGAGKTINSLGLTRAWVEDGRTVAPFKKGPDYIDAMWLGLAARRPASNIDPFFMSDDTMRAVLHDRALGCDVAVIEGNRGLFDGMDVEGSCSTASVARALEAPVLLSLDCTKMTRTAAAVVAGVANFEQGVRIGGVILNRTAGERHRAILRSAIEQYTDVPVLGALPKISPDPIPERHMGLVSNREYAGQEDILANLARIMRENTDLDRIWSMACSAPTPTLPVPALWPAPAPEPDVIIGYVRDDALWFYYEENLEALRRAGARLVKLSLVDDAPWPTIHGLYLGGGFPETLAARLSANTAGRERVRALADAGLPLYAECGGFMYLGKSVTFEGKDHPMAGVLDIRTVFEPRPQGLGYSEAVVDRENPFHPLGARLVGHEFHYSRCVADGAEQPTTVLDVVRGTGTIAGRDGIVRDNVFAGYMHIHALGAPWWAPHFVAAARRFRDEGA